MRKIVKKRIEDMTICIASPFSPKDLVPWLDENSRSVAEKLSSGIAPAVTTLAIDFLKLGHKLVIFTLDPLAEKNCQLSGTNLIIYIGRNRFNNRFRRIWSTIGGNILLIRKLFSLYKGDIDVISAHWTREYAIASLYFASKYPIFVTVRDIMPYIITQVPKTIKSYVWLVAAAMNEYVMRRKSFHFIANSDYTASSIQKLWGISAPIIYNPLNKEYLIDDKKNVKKRSNFSIVSISVSPFDDNRKNIISLVKAFQVVRKKHPNVTLYLIGPYLSEDNKVVREYREKESCEGVKFVGGLSHHEVIEFLRTSNLMVHPSLEETFGNTLIEAMASNCATLGGIESGAVPFVLEHGKAGFLCDVKNYFEIAQKIIYIIEHPEEKERIEEYAKKYCLNNFSSSVIANKYLELFKATI